MNISLPPDFIDENPERGPWLDPNNPPELYVQVEVLLHDGTTSHAQWMRMFWWNKGKLDPLGWRHLKPGGF